ncbi:hypothetical protein EYW49_22015 [Siculibacillus lacustris]|uniref:DUF4376 domain-containing protein n=1 Tax=Siculibacillus lacustris TaxID=1549641 RepID=A0A4Q9VDB3_9HYPH|nr:hypothetical protein [Siculibacillus lacustris]TBW32617.1 hypothetical protein EYW49_22015 [Siculibacillus lacustris]
MKILTYQGGVAVDCMVAPEGATISADGRRLTWVHTIPEHTRIVPAHTASVTVDATTEIVPAATIDDGIDAPDGCMFVAATEAAGIGWHIDEAGSPCPPVISLDEARTAKVAELRAACSAAIVGGFVSAALGSPHTYPSKPTDQTNLMGSVVASMLPGVAADWSTPFWCADGVGEWAFLPHTAAQIQTAGADGKAWVVTCQTSLDTLTAEALMAPDAIALAAITWAA